MQNSQRSVVEMAPRRATKEELIRVHAPEYVDQVLDNHTSFEWSGQRPDLSHLASLFAGGTLEALDVLLQGRAMTAIHFPGAKHHAQYDHSSGFCVFADFALAADIASKDFGKKVVILDIDGHHGDGTENLTADNPNVLTFSIHEKGIFPGTGNEDIPDKNVYNHPLVNKETGFDLGKTDDALGYGIGLFLHRVTPFNPDLIFVACGADGHREDPLTGLGYSVDGYVQAAKLLRMFHSDIPILVGGAGGYLPDTRTPEVWAAFSHQISLLKGE